MTRSVTVATAAVAQTRSPHASPPATTTPSTSTTTTTLPPPPTTTTTTLPGGCSSPTVIPAQGGTFSGTTSGASSQAGSCGRSREPARAGLPGDAVGLGH